MRTHCADSQANMNPEKALQYLKQGNLRFQNNLKANRNFLQQVNETSSGQFPFAVILSCIDSRTSAELIFDQGLGDILSVRIAGNFINPDILGSMEFACDIAGSKLILILGHSCCSAITAACRHQGRGHFLNIVEKIQPSVLECEKASKNPRDSQMFIEDVSQLNVKKGVETVRKESPLLAQMEKDGVIGIVGGMYNVKTGSVEFF